MRSAIYEGNVVHHRHVPRDHRFEVGMFMLYMNIDDLPELFRCHPLWSLERFNVASFRRKDYLGDVGKGLKQAAYEVVEDAFGEKVSGPVCLLTHARYGGHIFNPVSFYYVFASDADPHPKYILAEITNTPWKERHTYPLRVADSGKPLSVHEFDKEFHVSPFMEMDHQYRWSFSSPGDSLRVGMMNLKEDRRLFDVSLDLRRRPWERRELSRVLWRYPLMTVRVVSLIHWHAARLWMKRVPFVSHPSKREARPS
ncbi:MAG: DUF1365 domain-containing protein [Candidatus Eisenbacteria bacterium]|uniref:DUF1365 domain-containing protein n=1 Tax=Eiseniibacteriota bacterium TaxID=2212470 RepID=A0A7Y2E8P3_UNCEI|nr:DUF1365 domain-containing protein [Candidatus Eisenbacteria bacterium]